MPKMIERPPMIYRWLIPGAVWRCCDADDSDRKVCYLTFDDGPIPEVTPQVLEILDRTGVKATFFMVGDNVERHPHLLDEVRRRGHAVGNHTMHHCKGYKLTRRRYADSIAKANELLGSKYFRPPHGFLRWTQLWRLRHNYTVVMHDLLTLDYAKGQRPWMILKRVRKFVRPGSIIVFHDSLKAKTNLLGSLEGVIESLRAEGYEFRTFA